MEGTQKNKMAEIPIKKLVLKMGLPMIISMVLQALYNVVDSVFVANMGEKGAIANQSSSNTCFSYSNFNYCNRCWNWNRIKCTIIQKFRRKKSRKSK